MRPAWMVQKVTQSAIGAIQDCRGSDLIVKERRKERRKKEKRKKESWEHSTVNAGACILLTAKIS